MEERRGGGVEGVWVLSAGREVGLNPGGHCYGGRYKYFIIPFYSQKFIIPKVEFQAGGYLHETPSQQKVSYHNIHIKISGNRRSNFQVSSRVQHPIMNLRAPMDVNPSLSIKAPYSYFHQLSPSKLSTTLVREKHCVILITFTVFVSRR